MLIVSAFCLFIFPSILPAPHLSNVTLNFSPLFTGLLCHSNFSRCYSNPSLTYTYSPLSVSVHSAKPLGMSFLEVQR